MYTVSIVLPTAQVRVVSTRANEGGCYREAMALETWTFSVSGISKSGERERERERVFIWLERILNIGPHEDLTITKTSEQSDHAKTS